LLEVGKGCLRENEIPKLTWGKGRISASPIGGIFQVSHTRRTVRVKISSALAVIGDIGSVSVVALRELTPHAGLYRTATLSERQMLWY
jgi:hypothetical protein